MSNIEQTCVVPARLAAPWLCPPLQSAPWAPPECPPCGVPSPGGGCAAPWPAAPAVIVITDTVETRGPVDLGAVYVRPGACATPCLPGTAGAGCPPAPCPGVCEPACRYPDTWDPLPGAVPYWRFVELATRLGLHQPALRCDAIPAHEGDGCGGRPHIGPAFGGSIHGAGPCSRPEGFDPVALLEVLAAAIDEPTGLPHPRGPVPWAGWPRPRVVGVPTIPRAGSFIDAVA